MYLVAGASGNVGGEVVAALLAAGERVRALTRGDGHATLSPEVEAVVGDLDKPETLVKALTGVHGVFLLPGYKDMPGVLAQAHALGVARVVQLSGFATEAGDANNAVTAYMLDSEQAVTNSGVPWTILRPLDFMSNALRWIPQLSEGDIVRESFADVAVAVIDPFDIAAVAVAALTSDDHDGRTYMLTGPEALTAADRVAVLAEALRRPLRLDAMSDAESRAKMSDEMPAKYVDAMFSFYRDDKVQISKPRPTVEQLLGR
ncbi:MAG TPA: NAD(P)H-binding protein [Acidothermaceae bacterium]|jgi:uncharacterized protein YbjT (DUF2867 family)|nr:NAD(P)H-binding protein [Acidothermaceae bacterium]